VLQDYLDCNATRKYFGGTSVQTNRWNDDFIAKLKSLGYKHKPDHNGSTNAPLK